MTIGAESEGDRDKRRHQRTLFDGIAERYEESRPSYPARVTEFVAATAALASGAAVLEIGCGTGQLTERLAGHGFRVTAIDIGPSMVAAARRRLRGAEVSFQVTAFEDLDAADGSFDLVISSAAFHWIDPEVAFGKSARLLRRGGWLGLLGTEERYDHPVGTALDDLWIRHGDTGGAWNRRPSDPDARYPAPLHRGTPPDPRASPRGAPDEAYIRHDGAGRRGYCWRERLGRNLIQAAMAMATSSHGENRMCRTARATMATRTRAMMAGMVIALL
ncbi:MAG: class I SAM-dependent methyltransferase [Streptosporangiaceae bacterium]